MVLPAIHSPSVKLRVGWLCDKSFDREQGLRSEARTKIVLGTGRHIRCPGECEEGGIMCGGTIKLLATVGEKRGSFMHTTVCTCVHP